MNKKENLIEETTAENAVEEVIEKPYTIRRLKDAELFPILDIIGKVFPEDLADAFLAVVSKEKSINEIGIAVAGKLIISILKNMGKVKTEVYELLSAVSGIPAAEIEEMEFGTTPRMLWDIVNNEKNASFFKELSKLS